VFEGRLEPADIIVVSTDADGAGLLEAADLVRAGLSTRVAVFADPPDEVVDREFIRRGVPYDDRGAKQVTQLRALGVPSPEQVPRPVAGTEDEGRILPEWCDRSGFRRVIVVASADHSRRLERVLRRSMTGHRTRVAVRASRYSPFDPERWWESRGGTRTFITEMEKLILDVALHPLC
jgi:hypothetical protein